MEDCEKFSEKFCYSKLLQPPKHGIYDWCRLHAHKKRFITNLGTYPGLYIQSDTLLLANLFENFRNMCLEI